MKIWIILTADEYASLMEQGFVTDNDEKNEDLADFPHAYEWLNGKMAQMAARPDGAVMPLFGWIQWEPERVKPDLRWMRWNWYPKGDHVLVQAEVNEDEMLRVDSNAWCMILNGWFISDNEAEADKYDELYGDLPFEKKKKALYKNWDKAFMTEYKEEDSWRGQGSEVYALFWTLRKENIIRVEPFTSIKTKDDIKHEEEFERRKEGSKG